MKPNTNPRPLERTVGRDGWKDMFLAFRSWPVLLGFASSPQPTALQAMLRRVEDLLEMQQMERNRLGTAETAIAGSLKTVLDTLEKELDAIRKHIKSHINNDPDLKRRRDLLESIPGIGPATSAWLLTLLSSHYGFTNAKQAAAYAGLAPKLQESGKRKGKTTLSKTGDPGLRKALYMPILNAWQYNPAIPRLLRTSCCQRQKRHGRRLRRHAQDGPHRLCHP